MYFHCSILDKLGLHAHSAHTVFIDGWELIMNITLGKEFERRITEKVSDGLYTSASEVIRDGL